MSNDWKPNAPDLTKEFNQQRKPPTRPPVSRVELEMLEAEREKPVMEQHLTPGGSVEMAAKQQTAARRELRIGTIRKRLARQKGRARDDFSRAR